MAVTYRLGFLLCDHTAGDVAARFGDYPALYRDAFADVAGHVDWRQYDATRGELPDHPHACDGYLVSGSRHSAYDELPWIADLAATLRAIAAAGRPLVGLCFGHQLIAHALGGEVRRAASGWGLGLRDYELLAVDSWMDPPRQYLTLPVSHQDQVVRLPAGAVRLAGSAHCAHFVVAYAPHVLGIQGHPEFSAAFLGALIDSRAATLPADVLAAARASLARTDDSALVRRWIARFLGVPAAAAVPP